MRLAAIAVFLMAFASDVSAQTLNINGASISLGESEAKARADIAAADMTIDNAPGLASHWLRIKRGDVYESIGGIAFKDGKAYWIDRDWYLAQTPNDKNLLAQVSYSAVARRASLPHCPVIESVSDEVR